MEGFVLVLMALLVGTIGGYWHGRRLTQDELLFDDTDAPEALVAAQQAVVARTKRRLERIMTAARKEGKITNDGVEELFCISDRTASTYLKLLVQQGSLERQGAGRGTYYVPVELRQ